MKLTSKLILLAISALIFVLILSVQVCVFMLYILK
jgi:hypothetical protein